MWDDIIIGKGNKGNTAIKVFAIPGDHGLSHNVVSYWISGCIFDIGMTIFKNTDEGKRLNVYIESGDPIEEIQEWLDKIVLQNLSVKKLYMLIAQSNKYAFESGRQAKAEEIRYALEF